MPATPITLAYGDGIGPEVMDATLRILQEAEAQLQINVIEIGAEVFKRGGSTGIPADAWESLRRTKILFKAPITTPEGFSYDNFLEALSAEIPLSETILQQSGEALPTYAHAVKRSGETLTVFEANHGAALDIAEQNIADPSGLIHAAILLLQHVDQQETATLIHHAWLKAQEDNILPAELGTAAYAEAIIDRLGQQPTQQQ